MDKGSLKQWICLFYFISSQHIFLPTILGSNASGGHNAQVQMNSVTSFPVASWSDKKSQIISCRIDEKMTWLNASVLIPFKCFHSNKTQIVYEYPTRVHDLDLSGNVITKIQANAFLGFRELRVLNMTSNPVRRIDAGVFRGLPHLHTLVIRGIYSLQTLWLPQHMLNPLSSLTYLDLSINALSIDQVTQVLCGASPDIDTLILDEVFRPSFNVSNWVLDGSFSQCLRGKTIRRLSLGGNNINIIKPDFILNLPHLEFLILRSNMIMGDRQTAMHFSSIPNMTYFDVGCQMQSDCFVSTPDPFKAVPFDQSYNQSSTEVITTRRNRNTRSILDNWAKTVLNHMTKAFGGISIKLLSKLRAVKMDHMFYDGISMDFDLFKVCLSPNVVNSIDVSYTPFKQLRGTFSCMPHLRYLNMNGIKSGFLDPKLFQELTGVEVLLLSDSSPIGTFDSSSQFFKKNINLRTLDLSNNHIKSLPRDIFGQLTRLEYLNLSNNEISSTDFHVNNLTSLRELNLSYNKLVYLPTQLIENTQRLQNERRGKKITVDLRGNQFRCDCETANLLNALLQFQVHLPGLHDEFKFLECTLHTGESVRLSHAVSHLVDFCHSLDNLWVGFYIYISMLIIILNISLSYRYRWKLNYAKNVVAYMLTKSSQVVEEGSFLFDIFLSYCSADENFILNQIFPNLVTHGSPKYSVCVDFIHFIPGAAIVDNIVSSIFSSRTTILIVTPRYVRSGWCQFEAEFAQAHRMKHKHKIIAVLHPEVLRIPTDRIPLTLRTLLETVNYLKWPRKREGRDLFWWKLRRALGSPIENRAVTDNTFPLHMFSQV